MTITGKTDDGKLIVSSWGQRFFFDSDDYKNLGGDSYATFQVVEYEK